MIDEFKDEYSWLSNFAPCEIVFRGRIYPSVEHAYMSAKSNNADWMRTCRDKNIFAGRLKRLIKKIDLVENWNDIKVDVMRECLLQKFNQEPYKTLLIDTGNEYIQEGNTWNDTFWGFDIKINQGKNILGKLIMEIRSNLV